MSLAGARFVETLFKLENTRENFSLFVCALQRRIVSDEMLFCTWKLFDIVFVSFQPPLQSYGCLKMVNRTRAERLPLWDLTWLMWVAIACWLCWNCTWDWFGVVLNWTIGLFWGLHRFFYWLLQSSQVKRTPQNSALMNLLCEKWIPKSLPQPVLNSNLHSCMSD